MGNKKLDGTHVYHISGSGTRTDEQLYEMAMAEFKDEFYFELSHSPVSYTHLTLPTT